MPPRRRPWTPSGIQARLQVFPGQNTESPDSNARPASREHGGVDLPKQLPDFLDRRRIRIVVADDSGEMRRSLCDFLGTLPSVEVAGVATDGSEAGEVCAAALPDLVLIDFAMPRLNGLDAARELRGRCPGSRLVVISNFAPYLAATEPRPDVDAIIDKIDLPRELPAVIERLFPGRFLAPRSS